MVEAELMAATNEVWELLQEDTSRRFFRAMAN